MPEIAERLNIRVSRRHVPPGAALLPIAGSGSELKATADEQMEEKWQGL